MTWRHIAPRPRDAFRPSFASVIALEKSEGAGKAGWPLHPGPSRKKDCAKRAKVHRYRRRHSGLPRAVVYGLYALSLVSQCLFATIIPQHAFAACARLDASVGASGPHDFAVRIDAARLTTSSRPPQPASRVVTIAIRPLCRGGMRGKILKIRNSEKRNIFARGP